MEDFMTGVTVDKYMWALKEDVRVTLVASDPDLTEASFLVERLWTVRPTFRIAEPRALVLSFDHNHGIVLINGKYIDLGDDLPAWCGMTDELTMGPNCEVGSSIIIRAEL